MKKILLTGGAGFIGSNFIIYMLNSNPDVEIINLDNLTYAGNLDNLKSIEKNSRYKFIQGDICNKEIVKKIFTENDISYVINMAAESHVDRSISDPDIFIKTNVMGTLNLLNNAKAAWSIGDDIYKDGVKFVQVSTDEVYGALGQTGFFMETTPLDPHSPYSASKTSADLLVKAYFDTYKFPMNITRCSNNYGPYQFPEKLIPLMINNVLSHKELPVYGDGLQIRDWLYVEDHCKAIDLVTRNGKVGEVYNIGGHNERTNIAIVKLVIDYIHQHKDAEVSQDLIRYVADRKGHDRRYGIDATKIKNELGWEPETNFETGIVKTIEWYLSNREWSNNIISGEYTKYYEKMYMGK